MLVTFDYSLSFGKGHSGEGYIEMELTDEECKRLQVAQESGEEFIYCKLVKDIYDRVYELADEDATQDLIFEGILDEGRRASESYLIEAYYPE